MVRNFTDQMVTSNFRLAEITGVNFDLYDDPGKKLECRLIELAGTIQLLGFH